MRLMVILAVLLTLSTSAFGADLVKSTLSITPYPGSTPLMEVSASDQDMLDSIKGVLTAVNKRYGMDDDQIGGIAKALDLPELVKALSDLKEVRVVEMELPQTADLTPQKVTDFYADKLSKEKDWSRVYWITRGSGKQIAVYSLPKGNGLFITSVRLTSGGRKVVVARTSGRIDFGKVTEWALKHLGPQNPQVQQAESKPQPAEPVNKP